MRGWGRLLAGVLALSALAWLLAAWPIAGDVRVVNRSGQAVRGLSVCLSAGFPEQRTCRGRERLATGQSWRVLIPKDDGGVTLSFSGQRPDHQTGAYVTRGLGARFVIGAGGRVTVEVR
ncbi:hypothetical protein SAMN04488058_101459 [Deinococcus reticulitermitis]|uniref:Uncharacterized protein n=1 Tax=Deinococcus reticulitermitis TaxID=856736 RepID=A0A1H6T9K7_9DEIO|nr:hypothetical protein [Deinococcus reticulitermitis]SEI73000.1 hypothetical protein SAMN04488058_101459 [Deinococcus reticulitermitis]